STTVRGTNLNQVYIGVFRPDPDSLPRWFGNLKQYQLALDSNNNLFLADAQNPPISVESTVTGFVVDNAVSFWTTSSSFWSFQPSGNPPSSSDLPDGAVVEKGATAEVLRKIYASSQSTRPLFTCINCTTTTALSSTAGAATSFDPTNTLITQSALKAGSSQERSDIINWVRGTDNMDENLNGVTTDIRASILGDVLHSRPAVVNYNRNNDNDDVVVFYGSNDGIIHAIKGGQKTAASSTSSVPSDFSTSGYEKWGFIPQEFLGQFKRLRDNVPAITKPGVPASLSFTATTTSGSPVITGLASTQIAQLSTGVLVSGAGIPTGSLVISGTGGTITISQNATASGSASLTFTSEPKPYFADGPIGVFICDKSTVIPTPTDLLQKCRNGNDQLRSSDGDIVQIFIAMRRGGRFIYALDVTNPESSSYLWKKGCFTSGGTTTCDAGYQELGQTWSQPIPVKLNINGTTTEVLIFGGGYDPMVEDQDPIPSSGANSTDTMGRGIFVIDATNGNVIWQAGPVLPVPLSPGETFLAVSKMTYSIPSDVAVIDRDRNGLIDRAYAGDTGGNVWRVDFSDPDPSNWRVYKLASLGFAASQTNADRRKFLYPPSVVPASDSNGAFDAVLLGSGDREHPFNGYGDSAHPLSAAVTNRFYMLKDRNVSATQAFDPTKQCPATNTSQSASFVITDSGASVVGSAALPVFQDLTSTNLAANSIPGSLDQACGWFITLDQGEKDVGSAVTVAGTTFFNTNKPSPPAPGVCTTNLGIAREFAVNYLNAGAVINNTAGVVLTLADRFAVHPGGGFLPSPVPVVVNLAPPSGSMPVKSIEGTCIGTDCKKTPSGAFGARIRTYWYGEIE
ncbi:MAG: pilus assembly protein, partial [Burkholderiales bacterium]